MPPTPFRSFSLDDFCQTPTWSRLSGILNGTGGCYGLSGPSGAGKTWLMLRAIEAAEDMKGLGLLFPCPGAYEASEFLAALSETMAAAVQQRFRRDGVDAQAMRWLRFLLGVVVGLPVTIAVVVYLVRGLGGSKASHGSLISVFPGQVWAAVVIATALLVVLLGIQVIWAGRPGERLAREATAMIERVRFTASLRLATEAQLGRSVPPAGYFRRARERALAERPVTVASLVFDFRKLAKSISGVLSGPLVIGIDELDKAAEPEIVRSLMREIKGIFEIAGVFFIVALSEETAGAVEMGPLPPGSNELNSSFYTILELPPLDPQETADLLAARHLPGSRPLAKVLCVLGAGNWREITRLAEHAAFFPAGEPGRYLSDLIMTVSRAETVSLLREITGNPSGTRTNPLADEAKLGAWNAFPPDTFMAGSRFTQRSKAAIREWWQPRWHDAAAWQTFRGPWQRLLVRLFISGRVMAILERSAGLLPDGVDAMMTDLRDVVIMAGRSPGVARFMLMDRFGTDLDGPYQAAARDGQ